MDRRTFLVRVTQVGALSAFSVGCDGGDKPHKSPPPPASASASATAPAAVPAPAKLGWFSDTEARTAAAMIAQLLPAGSASGLPGGNEVGVLQYLDAQLQLAHFGGLTRMMRSGFDFVNRVALRAKRLPFHELPPALQASILSRFQRGSLGGMKFPQARFFAQFHSLAMEGYLGAPKYGGNRDAAVWKALGFDTRCHHMFEGCS